MEAMVAMIILVTTITMDTIITTVCKTISATPSFFLCTLHFQSVKFNFVLYLQINPVDMASHHGVVATLIATSPTNAEDACPQVGTLEKNYRLLYFKVVTLTLFDNIMCNFLL